MQAYSRTIACTALRLLHMRLEPRQGLVPLAGDGVEIGAHLLEALELQLEPAFAAGTEGADDAGVLEHAQMLGHRLARQARARGEARDRLRLALRQLGEQRQARAVAQRREDLGAALQGGRAATTSRRHALRCSPAARPSRGRSCGRPQRGDSPGLYRIRT